MTGPIVIVGGGHAAAQLCAALADAGQGALVHVVCEEPTHPYHRPPLSKSYLKNPDEAAQFHRDEAWYIAKAIHLHIGDAARSVDRAAKKVVLASGRELPYGKLVLATGTRARTLPALQAPLDNVMTLRSVADAEAMRQRLQRAGGGDLVVLGGGFIGLEVAATARHLGWQVQVLEAAPRLLARSASPELSAFIAQHHRELGARIELGATVDGFEVDGKRLLGLRANGDRIAVDQLLVGIGATPEVALAQAAGLKVDNGIVVDASLVTSDPDILAIGDCSAFPYRGQRIRLESVQNANDQAKAAAAMLLGQPANYAPTPFFWSDQGGLRLQMVGLWRPGLEPVRRQGSTPSSFSLFHYDGADLVAVESANAPLDHMQARKLMEKGVSPAKDQVADPQVQLKALLG